MHRIHDRHAILDPITALILRERIANAPSGQREREKHTRHS